MSKMTQQIRDNWLRSYSRRIRRLANDADILASGSRRISDMLSRQGRELGDFFRALDETIAFGKEIQARQDAMAGQAREDSEVAADFAHEAAHAVTLALNLPEFLEATDTSARFTIPAGATEEMVQKVIDNLSGEIRRTAKSGGAVTFGLVVRK